ncbi:MAG: V-type ATP synthase subunit F, partial [Planctomycetota bacterium]
MKYSIIGDEDAVLGFGMVGVSGKVAANADEARRAFQA